MDNWDTARQYVDDYNKSVGEGNEILRNATDENEQYLDSVQGKWNSIKEDLKATGLNIIDSEMAKDGLDFISSITSALPKASEKANEFYSTLMGGNFQEEMSDNFYEAFEKMDLSGKLKGFSAKISDFIANAFGDNKITNAMSDMFKGLSENNFLDKWMTDVSTLFGKSMDTITNLIPGISSLKGVGEILNINSEKKQLEDSIDGHKNRIGILQEEIGSMTEQQKKLNSISEEYEKLSKNTKRSAEEEEKYLNLKNEIASVNPDLVLGYDSSGSPILKDLKLQNEQYDRQIKLKQQSLRLEENALATDTQKQRLQNLEDYNKALEEYNNSQLYSDTKRKDGFFTDESLQDYAKRLKESNAEIEKANLESYSKRLEDHQKYLDDERAIQEKYINQMESSNSFEKMSESAKQNMLTFMDTLNWSEFSDAQASSFARQLEDVSDKIVSTTDEMGEYGKKINEISDAYANHESNMIGYTKALGDIYEASGKFDNQSLMQWFDSLKQYGSLTGDLNGVNACINEMATSLEKVTGIDASNWKTAFEFDPAPIDASSKALQNFLKSYNTGVQNLGKGGLADKLKSQFETLQSSYLQLTEDVANGGEIDIEYLANIKINQPEPIQNLIDEIISDNEVTEQEIELLMMVMPEILNTGEISEETYQQIADTLGMDVQEVKAKFNINAEVDGNFEEVQKYIEQWDGIEETDKQLLLKMIEEGGSEIEGAISKWNSLSEEEKQQTLRQLLEKDGDISGASQEFENAQEGEKKQTLSQNVEGQSELQAGKYTWEEIESGDKNNNLNFKVSGEQNVKDAGNTLKELPDKKEINVEVKSNNGNGGILDTIKGWFKKDATQSVEVDVKGKVSDVEVPTTTDATVDVKGEVSDVEVPTTTDSTVNVKGEVSDVEVPTTTDSTVNVKGKVTDIEMPEVSDKTVTVQANVSGEEQVNTLQSNINSLQSKAISVTASVSGTDQINTLKTGIAGLQGKAITVTASVSGTPQVQSLKSAIDTVQAKTVSVTANVTGTDAVKALTSAINAVKSKSVKVSASVSGTSEVRSLASAIASVNSKTVSVKVNKTVTTTQKTISSSSAKSMPTISDTPSTVSATNLSNIPISASDTPTTEGTPSLANIPISAKASRSSISDLVENGMSGYKDLEQVLERLTKQLEILDKRSEIAFGANKVKILEQQIDLYREQQGLQKKISSTEAQQLGQLKSILQQKGFQISADGDILNYEQKILEMQKNVDSLNKRAEGDSKNEGLKKQYESANEELGKTKKYLDEFINSSGQLSDCSAKWWELQKAIRDAKEEIIDINNKRTENRIELVTQAIDLLDSKIQNAFTSEKIALINKQTWEYEKQQKVLEEYANQLRAQLNTVAMGSDKYDELSDKLADLQVEWNDLQKAVRDNRNEVNELLNLEIEGKIDKISKSIERLDANMENANDKDTIKYLEEQNKLYKEQQVLLNKLANRIRQQLSVLNPLSDEYKELAEQLADLGIEWQKLQNTIADNKMQIFEQETAGVRHEIELLEGEIDLLDAKMDSLDGTEKLAMIEQQNALYRKQQDLLHALAEQIRQQMTLVDKASNEYKELQLELLDLQIQWNNLQGAITDNKNEVTDYYKEQQEEAEKLAKEEAERLKEQQEEAERLRKEALKLEREKWQLKIDSNLQELQNDVDKLRNSLELLEAQFDNLDGIGKLNNIKQQINLYEQLGQEVQDKLWGVQGTLTNYQIELGNFGFTFDADGDIANYKEQIQSLKNTLDEDDFDHIDGLVDDYFDLLLSELPNVQQEIEEINSAIKDLYEQQLDITKEVEDKITEIYEKEYEKRLEAIEKHTDERIKMLEKEKDAYREMRDEQDYEKELKDQTDEIEDLRRKLEIAKRDNSIEGLKRQRDLAEELAKAEEELADMTQDKIDEDFEKNIDNEIERLEKEQESLQNALEEQFSDTNIAKMVQQALTSGFIEINGEVQTLQDALLNSVNESAEAYSVMGSVIKQELVDNLQIALGTMKELESIYKDLNVSDYGIITSNISPSIPNNNYNTNTKNITIGNTNITISGTVSDNILDDIEELIEQKNKEILKSISKGL